MPKNRKNQLIQCTHFRWLLVCRAGVWYADGRSNSPSAGRHSLGTANQDEARRLIARLDQRVAEDLGVCPRSSQPEAEQAPLELTAGRKLYEQHLARPRSVGGPKASTRKRYRTVFDKFLSFAKSQRIDDWRLVDVRVLYKYAAHLEKLGRRPKTQRNELVVLVQTLKWLINEGHLAGKDHIKLKFARIESQPAYCWRKEEARRIVDFCHGSSKLQWLGDVAMALAYTGLRISELADLRWGDLDLQNGMLHLPDETGYAETSTVKLRDRKSGRTRSFPIHPDLVPVFVRQRRIDAHVFHGPHGGRIKPDYVRNVLVNKVISELADEFPGADSGKSFQDGRLHSFRHYFASMCANSGVPIMVVMEWLGHANSEMVRHYYHLFDEESRRHMNRLDPLGGGDELDSAS